MILFSSVKITTTYKRKVTFVKSTISESSIGITNVTELLLPHRPYTALKKTKRLKAAEICIFNVLCTQIVRILLSFIVHVTYPYYNVVQI